MIACVLTFNSCQNSNADNQASNTVNTKSVINGEAEASVLNYSPASGSKLQTELDNAKKSGKAVFVVVTGNGVKEVTSTTTIANGAKSIYKNALAVVLNRDDASSAPLVKEWQLSGATLPLILVISPKGMPTGGYLLAQATPENVVALVPSPKLEEVYAAINSKKTAIVVFTKKL